MNIKDYIESGILEDYISGSVTDQERREVECMAHIYPEIKTEIDSFSISVENYIKLHEVKPADYLKQKIANQLDFNSTTSNKSISIYQNITYTSIAACIVLLIVSSILFYNIKLQNKNTEISNNISTKQENLISLYQNKDNKTILLEGTDILKEGRAIVFWNQKTFETVIQIQNLPKNLADQQYQLWVLVDGKPIDMGVFDSKSSLETQTLKTTKLADAFAVTIEPRGGSLSPTLTQLCLLGKISTI